jgi:hypothetical protein
MGQITKLIEIVGELGVLEDDMTIYAAEPWTAESPAVVDMEPESGGVPASASEHGMTYLLEVLVARDFLHDWVAAQDKPPTLRQQCERLIRYAVDDA